MHTQEKKGGVLCVNLYLFGDRDRVFWNTAVILWWQQAATSGIGSPSQTCVSDPATYLKNVDSLDLCDDALVLDGCARERGAVGGLEVGDEFGVEGVFLDVGLEAVEAGGGCRGQLVSDQPISFLQAASAVAFGDDFVEGNVANVRLVFFESQRAEHSFVRPSGGFFVQSRAHPLAAPDQLASLLALLRGELPCRAADFG